MRYVLYEVHNNVVPICQDILEQEGRDIFIQMADGEDIHLKYLHRPFRQSPGHVNDENMVMAFDCIARRKLALRNWLRDELLSDFRFPNIIVEMDRPPLDPSNHQWTKPDEMGRDAVRH
jgi:hypothetical protein